MAARETRSGLRRLLFASRLRGSSSVDELNSTAFPSWTPSNNSNMKAVEEPACLSVGTDVSAKYRGAFCEAKIKTVKRLVKVKVNLKAEGTSQVVHDDQVKGTLRVGSVVEVKTSEGSSSEAVISKLTDASLYTVVFDDGDEKTLRRTSLCLKGERHFAESETLDQLPLTNPEHFGTPVIGKKSNRGRRSSQAVADEENESSSSDEEEEERRVNDELLGKVCSIEGQELNLVLVVSPGCSEEQAVKKDHCLVRSFGDGKFSPVLRKSLNPLSLSSTWKPELSDSKGAVAAQSFLKSGAVPEIWKMDLSQILESSSDSDEKHSEEEPENEEDLKKKPTADSEPEEEADPEERDHFLQQLYKFMEDRGTPINKPPVLGYKDLNLFKLFRLVIQHGGYSGIESGTVWKQIYMDLGIPILNSAAGYNVKTAYRKYLFGFEEYCRSALITFRTIHHNDPRPPASPTNQRPAPEIKTSFSANHRSVAEQKGGSPVLNQKAALMDLKDAVKMEPEAESESDSDHEREELLTSPRGRRRCVVPLKDEPREVRKRTPRQNDQSERAPRLTDQSEHTPRLKDQSERGSRVTDQSERGSEDEEDDEEEEEEMEMPLLNSAERCESDPESDSLAGTRVRVKYGRGKTQKIYEAHIKKTDTDNGENFYLVHYYGWNVRYDEWVKADRIIWPNEKGSKKKRRGKLKNKDEPEGDEERPLKDDRPLKEERPLKCPGRRGRPLGSKNKTNGRPAERREPGAAIANGDNTPRRRTRRTSGMFDSDRASNEDSGNSSDDSESEDSTDKKSFPWRQAEPGLKGEVDLSPKQEKEEPETTPPSETTAPSMPQDTGPSQSQQRTEPEAAATPERKDTTPVTEASSKLKLPLMPQRSEPMVLLHDCMPPDSDTDSASESDSDREEATEDTKPDSSEQKTEDTKEDRKEERTEEECVKSAKSPVRDRNTNARSPNVSSPNAQSPTAGSPHKDRKIGDKSPLKIGVRSPLRDKHPGETDIVKSPLRQDRSQEETCPNPEPTLFQNTPNAEMSKEERIPTNQGTTQPEHSPKRAGLQPENSPKRESLQMDNSLKLDSLHPENSPKRDRIQLENSPKRERIQTENYSKRDRIQLDNSPRRERIQLDNSPRRERIQLDNSPRRDRIQLDNSPRRERIQPENSPRRERIQPENSPRRERIQPENSPRRERIQPESSPRRERIQPESSPRRERIQPENSPRRERIQPENSPRRERNHLENSPRRERNHLENSPRRERNHLEISPRRDRNHLENSPRRERNHLENSPRRDRNQPGSSPKRDQIPLEISPKCGENKEQSMETLERNEGNSTPLKRKALEQKTPDKKLKTDVEITTQNMAIVEDREKPADDLLAKAEDACDKNAETENVPEMGADALVCHEVDLDEPDDREKVSASEQLMLMRESHLLRAPPTPIKGLTSPVRALPSQTTPEQNCNAPRDKETQRGHERGGIQHEETNATSNGDRGQKRVLEGPHSPTVKKHKRPSHKRLTPHKPDKNGAGHSSDSEDQSRVSLKTHKHCPSPTSRGHKWTLHIDDLEKMSSAERISFLQEKLQEIRKYYLSLKSEVASIDRRRKRLKKKEREVSNTASASSSSDAAMSPSSSSPSQSSLAVEVR